MQIQDLLFFSLLMHFASYLKTTKLLLPNPDWYSGSMEITCSVIEICQLNEAKVERNGHP